MSSGDVIVLMLSSVPGAWALQHPTLPRLFPAPLPKFPLCRVAFYKPGPGGSQQAEAGAGAARAPLRPRCRCRPLGALSSGAAAAVASAFNALESGEGSLSAWGEKEASLELFVVFWKQNGILRVAGVE